MKASVVKLIAGSVVAFGLSAAAVAQMPPVRTGELIGSITVYVSGEYGQPLPVPVDLRLTPTLFGDPLPLFPRETGRGWVFEDIAAGDTYDLDIEAKGYQPVHQSITLADISGVSQSLIVYMKPVDETLLFHAPSGQFALAPQAEKEVQNGLKDFQSRKFTSGQKHLSKALRLAPGNPYVNYVAGIGYLLNQQLAAAQPYLEKSVSIDSRQVPALVALGNLQFQEADYAGAIQVLRRAVEMDSASWKSHWVLADCYLHEQNFQAARDQAEQALQSGKEKANQVELLLGEALAGLGDRQGAKSAVESFLNKNPHYPSAPAIQRWLDGLNIPAASTQPVAEHMAALRVAAPLVSPPPPPVELPPKEDWAPKDIDAEAPFVISGATCALPKVLDMASKYAERVATNLEEFSATEESEIVEVKRNKSLETPGMHTSSYMVVMDHSDAKAIQIRELRGSPMAPGDTPGGLVDMGAPGLVLVFHPIYRESFQWSCEGLGEWKDRPAWIVRFSQKADHPTSLLSTFETLSERYALPLKGRAWVAANGGQIMHLETDLVRPVTAIALAKQHFVVDYAPVSFQTHKVTLWLPENVNLYLQYERHYLHYYHHYSNFVLFWVGTSQKIGTPTEPQEQR